MEYQGIVNFKCPYCGHINRMSGKYLENQRAETVTCDVERGGCDKYFAIRPVLHATIEIFSMTQVTA
jgi:hypothetical protein